MPKGALERTIDSGLSVRGGATVGSGSGLGLLPQHNALPGLNVGDPHSQYLTPGRGDARYVPLARQVIAGNGLTGGGALDADRTLHVGVSGLGLSVGADTITLTSNSNPGAAAAVLATDATGLLTLNQLKFGTQITINNQSNIAAGPDIQFDASALLAAEISLHLVADSNNTGSGMFVFGKGAPNSSATELMRLTNAGRLGIGLTNPAYALDVAGDIQASTALRTATAYATTKVQSPLFDTATGSMSLTPVGDIILDPGDSDVLPGGNIQDDLGDYNRKWRTFFAAELYVETLVAQDVLSTIGGRIEVTPTTTLIADLSSGATTMDVKHNNLRNGEYAYMMAAPGGIAQIEAIKVVSAATSITGGWRYTITRNQDGTGANAWVSGDAVASLGKNVGEGHISLTATNTIYNHLGPTIAIYSRNNVNAWNAVTPVVALGNLESFAGYSAAEAGLAIGNDLTKTPTTGFKGLTADATNGLRLFSTALSAYNGATQTFYLAPTGLDMWLGPSNSDKRLTWNGTTFEVIGSVKATSGYIGGIADGWAIASNKLSSTNITLHSGDVATARLEVGDGTAAYTAGVKAVGATTHTAFWAGSAANDTANAKYRVTAGGSLYSVDATFGNSFKVDATGGYIPAPSSFNLEYGYKFKYGANNAAGLAAWYVPNSYTTLYLLNNMTLMSNNIVDANADSTIIISGAAGATKTSDIGIYAKRVVGGVDNLVGLTISNNSSAQTISFIANGTTSKIWHEANDGSGTGLNADLLDGMHASEFPSLSAGGTFTGPVAISNNVLKFLNAVAEPQFSTIGNGEIWLYMKDGGSGRRVLMARGKGTGGGTAETTILTTGT